MTKPFKSHFNCGYASRARRAWLVLALLATALPQLPADSLWHDDVSKSMFADKRAAAVGDLLTILIQENNTASKDNSTKTSKKSSVDAGVSSFLYSPSSSGLLTKGGKLPSLGFSSANDFSGGGTINNSEQIVARIAVRVIDVLPNNTLVIEGTREAGFAGEKLTIILRGVVRRDDISANNTIFSYNVAGANVQFISKGAVTDTQKKGWFNKVWDKLSPF